MKLIPRLMALGLTAGLLSQAAASTVKTVEFSEIGIPYGLSVTLNGSDSAVAPPDHVGAWSWDEDSFPATAKGWTHTSKFVQLELTEAATFTLTLSSATGVPWPATDDAARLAGTNLFPSFTLYRGWDTDAGLHPGEAPGTTLDQDHTFNNRGNIAWAEDVTYLDHLDNATAHTAVRIWILPAGKYTVNLGGNSPVTLAEGRQGYSATFATTPAPGTIAGAVVSPVEFSEVGIPYGLKVQLGANSSAVAPPDHVGAWSWDEDSFPTTAKGWTHTSKFVQLDLTEAATFTLTLSSATGVPWPATDDAARLAGTNLFPSFTLYRGWDTDAGITTNADGSTLDQDHTFNNRGNIAWAEDVVYLDHLDNSTAHTASRTWILPAGKYTVNLGGNSPVTLAEGRQGYSATFATAPAPGGVKNGFAAPVEFSEIGIPYSLKVTLGVNGELVAPADHVGAWSWDEDSFPTTAKGWTHTSKFVQLELLEPATLSLTLSSAEGVPWPATDDAARLAGTNLFPSFTLYRGWDTDAGVTTNADGTTLDQDHTFNNRGNIAWAEDVTYLDHLDNATAHSAARTWILPAGKYTVNLGGNSPVTLAEGRQGYKATFTTTEAPGAIAGGFVSPVEFSEIGIPYGLKVQLGATGSAIAPPDHVGAWSWDEDSFPTTAKGWTHTSKFVQLELTENAVFTLTLASADGVPWPATDNAARLAGTNLFPSFSIYRGWDTDVGLLPGETPGTTLDQDHTFNNRGDIAWAEDVTYLDHLDNATAHSASQTWILPAGKYTVNLGGNSPVTLAEGRQGYRATFNTRAPVTDAPPLDFSMADEGHFHAKWPASATGVTLFHAESLAGPWTPIEAELVPEGDEVEAHIHFHEDSLFLRLQ